MTDQLQPAPIADRVWFTMHGRQAFRFRPASSTEARAAGVQSPRPVAIVVKSCTADFIIVASGEASAESAAAAVTFAETVGASLDTAAELGRYLPCVRPDALASAAARLLRETPGCERCGCGVRWTALLAGIALQLAPDGGAGLAELEAEWIAAKQRLPAGPYRISDAPVVSASAAIREIGRHS